MKNFTKQIAALRERARIRREATGRKLPGEDRLAVQLDEAASIIERLCVDLEREVRSQFSPEKVLALAPGGETSVMRQAPLTPVKPSPGHSDGQPFSKSSVQNVVWAAALAARLRTANTHAAA